MVIDIKNNLENIINHFNLSLKDFNEDIKIFNITCTNYDLTNINEKKLIEYCDFFGRSFEISMRAYDVIHISGNSTAVEQKEFSEWIKKNRLEKINLTIKLNKKEYISNIFGVKDNVLLYINPEVFRESISYSKLKSNIIVDNTSTLIILPFLDLNFIRNEFLILAGFQCAIKSLESIDFSLEKLDKETYIKERVQKQKLYCNMGNLMEDILPDHTYFKERPNEDPFSIFASFDYMSIMLCLHFLANISKKEDFVFHGFKNIRLNNINQHINITFKQVEQTYHLYDSIYEVQTQDKLLIARNVISIHLPSESNVIDFVGLLKELLSSLTANFDSYIQDKIKSFFDKKKDLEKYVRDTCEMISKQISSASGDLSKSWLTLIGALIAGFITYSIRGDISILFFFFLIFGLMSFFTLRQSIWIAVEEKKALKHSYDHFIGLIDGINKAEVDKITSDLVDQRFDLLDKTIKKMRLFNVIFPSLLAGVLLGVGIYEFSFQNQVSIKIEFLLTFIRENMPL